MDQARERMTQRQVLGHEIRPVLEHGDHDSDDQPQLERHRHGW
jgi:hypothetical protein